VDAIWNNGIAPELISFMTSLNWFYIIMFINILYGLKYTGQFNWYDKILLESKLKIYKIWITAFILAVVHILFRWADPTLNVTVSYISMLSRSLFVAVIFSNIFVDIPALLIIKLRQFLEPKEKTEEDENK
jgi:uncharacterized membrane protein YcgQ (UPF0703/DUF1980 family)